MKMSSIGVIYQALTLIFQNGNRNALGGFIPIFHRQVRISGTDFTKSMNSARG